jgi:hypothetical protein
VTHSPRDSTTKRYPRAARRAPSSLAGPLRAVVYIFDRKGARGGAFWFLVLECGHAVARKRVPLTVGTMFRPLAEKLAPQRVQCHYCEAGCEKSDPWSVIKAFGGPSQ